MLDDGTAIYAPPVHEALVSDLHNKALEEDHSDFPNSDMDRRWITALQHA